MADTGEETIMASGTVHQAAALATAPRHYGRFGLHNLRLDLRRWRRSRPFWGGAWSILGGLVILAMPAMSIRLLIASGTTVLVGIVNGVLIIIFGLFLWFAPSLRQIIGVLIVVLGVASLVTADLGGFLIGMLLAMVGGALGFAWVPTEPRIKRWRTRRLLHLPIPAVQPDLELREITALPSVPVAVAAAEGPVAAPPEVVGPVGAEVPNATELTPEVADTSGAAQEQTAEEMSPAEQEMAAVETADHGHSAAVIPPEPTSERGEAMDMESPDAAAEPVDKLPAEPIGDDHGAPAES
jgi:hypothetical protein